MEPCKGCHQVDETLTADGYCYECSNGKEEFVDIKVLAKEVAETAGRAFAKARGKGFVDLATEIFVENVKVKRQWHS